jgi:NIPSNAP
MITLSIRYTLDASKLADFAAYAETLQKPIAHCGASLVGYYLPTKLAGPTNIALALIDFPSLAAYEQYRERLAVDPEAVACLRRVEGAGAILVEDRAILRRVTEAA